DGNGREREDRQQPRLAPKCGGETCCDRKPGERPSHRLRVVVRSERRAEHACPERREAESREPVPTRPREQQQREPEDSDRACDPREPDHRTVTVAAAACPCSLTTSLNVPLARGARSFSTARVAEPERRPSFHRYRF